MSRLSFNKLLSIFLFILGFIYVINDWSPSSYGFFLKQYDPDNTGIVWGTPRPIRSDEWGVVTPLTQATVNNDFQRYNHTSFYKEDLRINYGLPVFDWGLIFKPTMWGYLFLTPAKAFSLHWYLIFSLFIFGYFKLFEKIGLRKELALLLSVSFYFTGFSQFWWNEKGPVYAFFPWVIYILLNNLKVHYRLALFYWLSVSWFLTDFYPPLVVSLAFVGAIIIYCFSKEWLSWRRFSLLAVTSAISAGTAVLYLKDYILATSKTIYPGQRISSSGALPFNEWISQIFPFTTFDRLYNTFGANNICEVGAVGFAFVLMILIHIDYKDKWVSKINRTEKVNLAIIICGLIAMNLWMIAPVPELLGKIFLWDHVEPGRMKYAAGLMLGIVILLYAQKLRFKLSTARFLIYSAVVVAGWIIFKLRSSAAWDGSIHGALQAWHKNYTDLYTIIALLISYLLVRYTRISAITAFTLTSTLASAYVFFPFNPIQSSAAIFSPHPRITQDLDPLVDKETGVLAVPGYYGATLNGLGYQSVSHVTPVPHMEFWRKIYPQMPQQEFEHVFNRYSHIILSNVSQPVTPYPDQVHIPISTFINSFSLPKNSTTQTPLVVNGEEQLIIKGLKLPAGQVLSISPMIGTYQGHSDGALTMTICAENNCTTASKSLKTASDNGYLRMFLDQPLNINEQENVTITFKRSPDNKFPLAFWSDSSDATTQIVTDKSVSDEKVMPKLQFIYKR